MSKLSIYNVPTSTHFNIWLWNKVVRVYRLLETCWPIHCPAEKHESFLQ